MADAALAWPMVALALWSAGLTARLGILRVLAVRSRQVRPSFYRAFQGDQEPDRLRFASRHHSNLFEMPVLFYVACLLLLALDVVVGPWAVGLAWAFVGLRLVHSLIHLTRNPVLARFYVFALSNVALLGLWVVIVVRLTL